ncbi:dienelactone hydrolase family protein [Gordonia sp. NPDC003950]
MPDTQVTTPNGSIDAVLATPSTPGPWPGVVIVHDALGVTDDLRDTARRFADAGYLAIAPDMYSRGGRVRCIRSVMRDLIAGNGRSVDDILAARDHLAALTNDCTGQIGVAGFCMGGGFALLVSPKGFGASAPFYPSILPRYDTLVEGACPIVASFGSRDPLNIGNGKRLRTTLDRKGIANDVKVYQGVGHSFANQMPGQPIARIVGFGYDATATADAYERVFAFFGEHLVGAQA